MSYFKLFYLFFKVGLLTIGGGYAMIPVIQQEFVENNKIMSDGEFLDALSVSQASPGAIAINISVYIGYKLNGIKGAVVATIGSALPSFAIILVLSTVFFEIRSLDTVEKVFNGIRAAVVSMIALSLFSLFKTVKLKKAGYLVFSAASILLVVFNVNPALVILMGALSSIAYDRLKGDNW